MKTVFLLGLILLGAFQETPVPFVNAGLELKAVPSNNLSHPVISNVAVWQDGEEINIRLDYADVYGGLGEAEFWVQCFQIQKQKGLETQMAWPLLKFSIPQDPRVSYNGSEPSGTFAAAIPVYILAPRDGWTGKDKLRCRFFIYSGRQESYKSASRSESVRNSSNILEIELTPQWQREI